MKSKAYKISKDEAIKLWNEGYLIKIHSHVFKDGYYIMGKDGRIWDTKNRIVYDIDDFEEEYDTFYVIK